LEDISTNTCFVAIAHPEHSGGSVFEYQWFTKRGKACKQAAYRRREQAVAVNPPRQYHFRQAADGTDLAACWLRLEASDGNDFSLAEAIRYLEAGHARGKVVITVA